MPGAKECQTKQERLESERCVEDAGDRRCAARSGADANGGEVNHVL